MYRLLGVRYLCLCVCVWVCINIFVLCVYVSVGLTQLLRALPKCSCHLYMCVCMCLSGCVCVCVDTPPPSVGLLLARRCDGASLAQTPSQRAPLIHLNSRVPCPPLAATRVRAAIGYACVHALCKVCVRVRVCVCVCVCVCFGNEKQCYRRPGLNSKNG